MRVFVILATDSGATGFDRGEGLEGRLWASALLRGAGATGLVFEFCGAEVGRWGWNVLRFELCESVRVYGQSVNGIPKRELC